MTVFSQLGLNHSCFISDTDYEFVREGDRGVRKADLKPSEGGGKIIGTIAITVKDDPDMRDPPGNIITFSRTW